MSSNFLATSLSISKSLSFLVTASVLVSSGLTSSKTAAGGCAVASGLLAHGWRRARAPWRANMAATQGAV